MLVADILASSSFEVVLQQKLMIQLGKIALISGRFDRHTIDRGLRCLDEFRRMALSRRVERTLAVATSAIREAENGEEFLRRAREESGISVRVISGREEARLIHMAVSRQMDLKSRKALLIDIGGGSVEITIADADRIYYCTSVKLGFLRLQGRFVTKEPMSKREARIITAFVRDSLSNPKANIRKHAPDMVIGTSGSATSLLRLAQLRRDENLEATLPSTQVNRDEIQGILAEMHRLKAVERAKKLDLDPLRAEFLPTALLCLDVILEEAGASEITVCPVALREGLIYDFMSRALPQTPAPEGVDDLRLQAVLDLAKRCDYPAEHSNRVALLARQVFRHTAHLHGLGEEEGKMLEYAALLHDIGYHIGYTKHHKHAYYLIMNCDLRGFTPEERNMLANLVRYHRRAVPKRKHAPFAALPTRARDTVKALTSILRIADGLDRSHYSHVNEVRCGRGKTKIQFQLVTDARFSNVDLDLWAAKKGAGYFEKLFEIETEFVARKPVRATRRPRARRSQPQ
jgi:exopolyphosphatase/guanosine-5'-triphosphate,3'-diphosphate pyrophosphatase